MIYEATCNKCHERYNPHSPDPEDLEHGQTQEGVDCGGYPSKELIVYYQSEEELQSALVDRMIATDHPDFWPTEEDFLLMKYKPASD